MQLPGLTGELQHLLILKVNQNLLEVQLEDGERSVYCTPEHESALQVGGTGNPHPTTWMANGRNQEGTRFVNKVQLPKAWNNLSCE